MVPEKSKVGILVYPNCTYGRNLEADSFVCDLRSILPRLAELCPDLRFTLLLPGRVASLELPNVAAQIEWPLPTYPNTMRTHFDAKRFLEAVDWKNRSWDLVWSHLPEHTLQMKNVLYNATDERPPIIGYSHWCEIPELNSFAVDMFPAWIAGVCEMEFCGVTTNVMKETILRNAVKRGYAGLVPRLQKIIHPQYLGVEAPPAVAPQTPEPGLLIWNHRPHSYTGWPSVLGALDELWKKRQDFRVMCTLEDGQVAGKPYGAPSGLPSAKDPGYRRAYFELLGRAWAGLPRLVSHWTWPVAIADGMTAGMPYVVPRDYYVPEVFPEDYLWAYDGSGQRAGDELTDALDAALSAPVEERTCAVEASRTAAQATSWDVRIERFAAMFDWALTRGQRIGPRSKRYDEVKAAALLGQTKREIKQTLGWGVGIPWTPYANRLRDEGISVRSSD